MKAKIEVKVTYATEIEVEITEEMFSKIEDVCYQTLDRINDEDDGEVFDWLSDHVNETDAMDWEIEVQNIEEDS